MALWLCVQCGTAYAVGLPGCPHCRGTEYEEDGVAKITTGGGPSLHTDGEQAEDATAETPAAPVPVADQLAAGVDPAETVTIADQKAGAPPPALPKAPADGGS
jgi:predicted nucleic-acid-binding Zn-ribbon protein